MKLVRLTIPTMVLGLAALSAWPSAQAQVTVDVAKITCDQFTLYKITDPQNIAIWISGYYHGRSNNTVIDTQQLSSILQKVKDYCNLKPQDTVMHAVETVVGPPK